MKKKSKKFRKKWNQFKDDMKEIAAVEELEAPNVGTSNKTASESAAERQEELEKEIIERSKKLQGATEETAEETSIETAAETETEKTPEATPETPEAPTKTEEPKAEPKTEPKEAKAPEPEQPAEHEKAKEPEAPAKAKSKDEVKAASEAEAGNVLSEEEVEVIQEADAPKPTPKPNSRPKRNLVTSSVYPEGEDMIVRSRDFYNRLGDMAFEKDVRRAKNEELDEYLIESIEARPDLLEKLIDEHLEEYLFMNPGRTDSIIFFDFEDYLKRNLKDMPRIDEAIGRAHDANIKAGVRFVRKTKKEKFEYSTWEEAKESIQEAIDELQVDPQKVFTKEYYWIENPDEVISETEVESYASSFRGDKKALRKALYLDD